MLYPWLQESFEQFHRAALAQQLPHAIILQACSGVGADSFARAIAAMMLCEKKSPDQCGSCSSCQWYQAGSHPDLIELQCEQKSRVIKIDQVRSLIERLNKTAYGKMQVGIIHHADSMNTAAANALLKTLEEPPGAVLLLLISEKASSLPATIRSRCQISTLSIQNREQAIAWLQSAYPDKNAETLYRHTLGSPLHASDLIESGYFELRDRILGFFCGHQKTHNIVTFALELSKETPSLSLKIMQSLIADLIKIHVNIAAESLCHADRVHELEELKQCSLVADLQRFYQELLSAKEQIEGKVHLNLQMVFESLLLKWINVTK